MGNFCTFDMLLLKCKKKTVIGDAMTNSEIEKNIQENTYKLLGEILVDDEQYADLFSHSKKRVCDVINGGDVSVTGK